ncbi:MAG: zf-HC2 domain-containing protein [Ignavibacteria bacterium]|nr:zf-HC2 domain-containing protein [Ignavibacteria bacterium]
MKTHRTIQKNLYGYLRDELSVEDRQAIETHMKSCATCAGELQSMREAVKLLTQKARRPSERRSELYWQQFAEKVERRIQSESAEGEPHSFVGRLLDLLVENRKPFSFGFASALSLIVLAFAVWSLWTEPPALDQVTLDSTGYRSNGLQASIQKTAMEVRAADYLEQSKVLLIGIMNTDTKSLVESKSLLRRQREVSRTLVRESQEISSGLTDPSQQRLRELVSDLGLILVQIANLETDHGVQGVEIVKGGVERNGILFKINLEEMQRAAQPSRNKGDEKQAKSNI